jgi:hypothetical protein
MIKTKKINKHEEFNKQIVVYLGNVGKRMPDSLFNTPIFLLKTKAGDLAITLASTDDFNGRSKRAVISLFGQFIDPTRAKQLVDCNPFSGKWNWHWFGDDNTVEYFVNKVMWDINKILKEND